MHSATTSHTITLKAPVRLGIGDWLRSTLCYYFLTELDSLVILAGLSSGNASSLTVVIRSSVLLMQPCSSRVLEFLHYLYLTPTSPCRHPLLETVDDGDVIRGHFFSSNYITYFSFGALLPS